MAKRNIPKLETKPLKEGDSPSSLKSRYPGNSYAERDETDISAGQKGGASQDDKEKIKPRQVAQGKVRKQSLVRKFAHYIIADTVETARERTFKDILIPGVRNLIFDTFNEMLATMLFPDDVQRPAGGYRGGSGARRGGKTSYDKYYDDKNRRTGNGGRGGGSYRDMPYDPDDIILDTRAQANDALDELDYIIHKYGQASIANFYDIVGVTGEWTDNRYGWTSIRGAAIKPVRDGFMVILPPTRVLED